MFKYEEGDFSYEYNKCLVQANSANCFDIISGLRVYFSRVLWFLLCNDINIFKCIMREWCCFYFVIASINNISDNNERSSGSHCIGIGQTRVDNIDGHNCVCQPDGKLTDTVLISHCSGVVPSSHAILNKLSTRKIIESNITSILATVCTTNALITTVQLPSTNAGNFK